LSLTPVNCVVCVRTGSLMTLTQPLVSSAVENGKWHKGLHASNLALPAPLLIVQRLSLSISLASEFIATIVLYHILRQLSDDFFLIFV